jgi:hypothetical protein
MALDRDAFFRNWVDTLFLKASWVDSVKQLTGITAVSQVWGERPEWYLWIEGAVGPYNLALHHTSELLSDGETLQQGFFAVKCYPYRDTALFSSFTETERELIRSDRFDHTNTPCFEARAEIPAALFSIGTLTITANSENSLAVLTFETLDALRVVQGSDKIHEAPADGPPPQVVRNVPGWEIGYPLFDRISALHAFSARCCPRHYRMTRAPGFEHSVTAGRQIEVRPSQNSFLISASLLFSADPDWVNRPASGWLPEIEPGEETLMEKIFSAGSKSPEECRDAGVNPLWWRLATAEFQCCLASTCGCSH